MCSLIRFTIMFIDSTPSSADRPCSGAAAACADMPSNVNRADLLEFEVLGLAWLTLPGCQ